MTIDPALTQIYPHIRRLIAPNPSVMTGPGTNTYFVGNKQPVIIDPGPANESHLHNTLAAVGALPAAVQAIILTHHHPDHSGNAEALRQHLNVPLLSFGQPLEAETELEVEQLTLVVKHTPGHIHAHICLWLEEQNLLFAGDLVAGQGTIVVIPPDGDMADYLASLRAMQELAPAAILPGHGPVIEAPQRLLQEYIDHRLMRERQVLECVGQGYTTAGQIAAQIYAGQPAAVLSIAAMQVEAHLAKLRREGKV